MAALRYFSQKILNKHIKLPAKVQLNSVFVLQNRLKSTFQYDNTKDPAPLFFNKQIQDLLYTLTRVDLSKVYSKRKQGTSHLAQPVYKFMTDDQLQEAIQEAKDAVKDLIQMPPVVMPRVPIDTILSKDPALQGMDTAKFVFTDITYGISNADRLIIVRDLDGTLKKVDWDVRDRMNQVYFPLPGREIRMPKMFEEHNLKSLLDRGEYVFILDRACLQFEPDDPEYHRITEATYLYVNEHDGFKALRSTRHFGPLSFYLCWFKMCDNLLMELLETGTIGEAICLVKLYTQMHKITLEGEDDMLVENYIKEHASKRGALELALQAFRELDRERRQLEEGIKVAHGH
ncbi:small ribosomal subunit protein mS22 [Atheta coriaria]|uniref:small ribosomal subunit protein mS22 n=1 Tax=Dalotia coriaria TaxID=877792 RepID=UPI0031F470A0